MIAFSVTNAFAEPSVNEPSSEISFTVCPESNCNVPVSCIFPVDVMFPTFIAACPVESIAEDPIASVPISVVVANSK